MYDMKNKKNSKKDIYIYYIFRTAEIFIYTFVHNIKIMQETKLQTKNSAILCEKHMIYRIIQATICYIIE